MADRLRPILDAYLAGGMPPNIALMRLCMEATSPEEVRGAVVDAAQGGADKLSAAGRGSSAARSASAGIRHAPSRIENSEWTWRWTNGTVSGTGKPS